MHSEDSWVDFQCRSLVVMELQLAFLIVASILGLVFALLYTSVDVNCYYIQVISLISNGMHAIKVTYCNVT
jgi:hypothetical protein